MTCIDTHAHVFSKHDQCLQTARYTPNYNATAQDYISRLDELGFTHGVLVQPSFFGTDNHVMLGAIQQYPKRLKGIAVVEHTASLDELKALKAQGIAGIRLNLFGLTVPVLNTPEWNTFLTHLETLEWQLELHAPPAYLVIVLPLLNQYHLDIVIDHFGRIDPIKGIDDPDYQTFLDLLNVEKHWIKVSGFYRLGALPVNIDIAQQAFNLFKNKGFIHRMVWGSDWPHTQHEAKMSYQLVLDTFRKIVPDIEEQKMILGENASRLFKF